MFFHSYLTTPPSALPSTLSQNQPGAETRSQHLHIWLNDMIMHKSSPQRIHSPSKCTYSQSFSHIPQAHCHTSTLPKCYTDPFTCLTDLVMHVILSQSPHTSQCNPADNPHSQTPQSMLCIDSHNVLHHPHKANPIPLTIIIKYHRFRHISLLPKRGYY